MKIIDAINQATIDSLKIVNRTDFGHPFARIENIFIDYKKIVSSYAQSNDESINFFKEIMSGNNSILALSALKIYKESKIAVNCTSDNAKEDRAKSEANDGENSFNRRRFLELKSEKLTLVKMLNPSSQRDLTIKLLIKEVDEDLKNLGK